MGGWRNGREVVVLIMAKSVRAELVDATRAAYHRVSPKEAVDEMRGDVDVSQRWEMWL